MARPLGRAVRYREYEMQTCTVRGCGNPCHGRGYCLKHYYRWYRNGDPLIYKSGYARNVEFNNPTPHDKLTFDIWNYGSTPLPAYGAAHEAARLRYIAQNERDGYLVDPEHIAAVSAWLAEPLDVAAD